MSNSRNSNNSTSNGKTSSTTTKGGKLRRPLSAYNIYFKSEREVIRAEVHQGQAPADYAHHVEAARTPHVDLVDVVLEDLTLAQAQLELQRDERLAAIDAQGKPGFPAGY